MNYRPALRPAPRRLLVLASAVAWGLVEIVALARRRWSTAWNDRRRIASNGTR